MTEESADVPRELLESIKDVIGRKVKIAVKKKVKLEVKGDKVENKVLTSFCFSLQTNGNYRCTRRPAGGGWTMKMLKKNVYE